MSFGDPHCGSFALARTPKPSERRGGPKKGLQKTPRFVPKPGKIPNETADTVTQGADTFQIRALNHVRVPQNTEMKPCS